MDGLEVLRVDNNFLVEPLPANLKEKQFPKLRVFDISKNYIKDVVASEGGSVGFAQVYLGLQNHNPVIKNRIGDNAQQYRLVVTDQN